MLDAAGVEEYWRGCLRQIKRTANWWSPLRTLARNRRLCGSPPDYRAGPGQAMGFRIGRAICGVPRRKCNRPNRTCRNWLKSHPNDACLLLALGKLCINRGLWGKAQNYLDASLSVEPGYSAHLALAQLNEKIGQTELAKEHYNKGMALALSREGIGAEAIWIRMDETVICWVPTWRHILNSSMGQKHAKKDQDLASSGKR